MRRRFEFDNNSIKIPSKNGVYYFLRNGQSVGGGSNSVSPQELVRNGEGVLCVFNKRHVLILPSSEHPSANWGRSGEIAQGVTNFQDIPNIYDTEEAFQGENDSINFLNKYGDVDEYGFYKASLITSPSGTREGRIPSLGEFMVMINASENNIQIINDHLSNFPVYTPIMYNTSYNSYLTSSQNGENYYWGCNFHDLSLTGDYHKAMAQGFVIPVASIA